VLTVLELWSLADLTTGGSDMSKVLFGITLKDWLIGMSMIITVRLVGLVGYVIVYSLGYVAYNYVWAYFTKKG